MIQSNSPMFKQNTVYKPFFYSSAVDMCVTHEKMHWHEGELDLSDDVSDWKMGKLTNEEKEFVTQILRMFTASDVAVGQLYTDKLIPVFLNNEIRNMLVSFCCREGVHQRAYALLNDTLGLSDKEHTMFLEIEEMADKDTFMRAADPSDVTGLAQTLVKGTLNEGVSLFASFVMLLNFQRRGLMKGMGKVVEWSVKDETKHVEGVTYLFRQVCREHPEIVTDGFKKYIYDMVRQCVDLEDRFIDLAFRSGGVKGIGADEVKQYIRYIADRRLVMLGLKPNYNIERNPLPWVDVILNAPDHTNFFENKVADYEVGTLTGEWSYDEKELRIYGREGCDFCEKARIALATRGIGFDYVDITHMPTRTIFYNERGLNSVPQIYKLRDGKESDHIGGYTELMNRLETTNV